MAHFPQDFLFGTATSATQVEGGTVKGSWDRWCTQPGRIADKTTVRRACDHWNRWKEDLELLKQTGCQTYRMGLDWARIEPEETQWDTQALDHYRQELEALRAAGIKPLVTLHHFNNPLWMEDRQGWLNPEAPVWFDRYTDVVLRTLGHLAEDWITINEPNVYLVKGYQYGEWPPGEVGRSDLVLTGARNFMEAHARGYRTIHRVRRDLKASGDTRVGVAHHLRVFKAEGGGLARVSAALHELFFQGIFLEGMTAGKLVPPLGTGRPWGTTPLADFIGVNYYSRDLVKGRLGAFPVLGETYTHPTNPRNDLGWEIYPEGLGILCRKLWKKYRLPLWITENGLADGTDGQRPQFLKDHLRVVADLIAQGVPVQRYYHWSLLDNFEWAEGEAQRFGLVAVDFESQKRTPRPSAALFARIAQTRTLPEDS